jgi:hypothetical protein
MNEGDIGEHMSGAGAQVAMEVPAHLGAVWGAGSKPRIAPLTDRGNAKAADEFAQRFCGVIVAALHEYAEPVAAQASVRRRRLQCDHKGTSKHCQRRKTTGHPCKRGRCPERLGHSGGGRGHRGPHPATCGPGRDAVEEGSGSVGGPKARQLRVTGCVEDKVDVLGQGSEMRGGIGEEKPSGGGQ